MDGIVFARAQMCMTDELHHIGVASFIHRIERDQAITDFARGARATLLKRLQGGLVITCATLGRHIQR